MSPVCNQSTKKHGYSVYLLGLLFPFSSTKIHRFLNYINMTEQYRNNYFKLVAVIVDIAFIVIREYVKEKILAPDSFVKFLNKQKHTLVHIHETSPCCECMIKTIQGEKLISRKQLLILYKLDDGNQIRDHRKYAGGKLTQICICKYSAKENINVGVLDITLANYIIQKCGVQELGIDNWIEQIKDVRNEIFHLSDIKEMTDQKFSITWSKLEGSIIGIAKVIGNAYAAETEQNIMQTKKLTIVGDNMLQYEIICRDYWKNKCAEFERAQQKAMKDQSAALHHTMPECFSKSMEQYCQKTMRKIETFNTMVDNINLMINIFGNEENVGKFDATEHAKQVKEDVKRIVIPVFMQLDIPTSWDKTKVFAAIDGLRLNGTPGMNIRITAISIDDLDIYAEIAQKVLCNVNELRSEINKMMSTMLSEAEITTTEHAECVVNMKIQDRSGVQLAETLRLEKPSILNKLRKVQKYDDFWFVLRSPGLLEYYTENPGEKEVMPLYSINILKYTEIKIKKDNIFKLVIGNKKLKLKANSEESREKWINAIQAIQNRQFRKTMFSSLPDMPDGQAELDVTCDNSSGQSIDEVKELASASEPRKSVRMSELFEVRKKPTKIVSAIDFGTTFSGAAFSTKSSFESNPLSVEIIRLDKKKSYPKTQTSVLFNAEECVAFGEEAERKYKTLSLQGQADDLFFFRNFKMQLHGEKLSKSMKLRTIDGKEKSCITVIAACIEHIKEKANDRIKQLNKSIGDIDIHWVLTVPAIWNEQARQFITKAAEKTGIDRENLSLALEPECAAVYCKHDVVVRDEGQQNSALQSFRPGSKFMVVDLGGGTVDITVLKVLESGKMNEISKASGGKWGGDTINKKIVDELKNIYGPEILRLRAEDMNSYLKLLADIESEKREYDDEDDFLIRLPEFLQKQVNVEELAGTFGTKIVIFNGKKHLLFSQEKMKYIFSNCISYITKHIVGLLEEAIEVSEIILVGGYASSPIVQTAFRKEFGQKFKLIIPQNPEMVVLTGAVISGHSNKPITERVAKYNYGLGIRASVDPEDRNLLVGNVRNRKIFHLLIEKGRRMDVGKYVESCRIQVDDRNQLGSIELYKTKSDNPEHEINIKDFTKIEYIEFKLPKLRKPTTFTISLWYHETEFRVIAEDENTKLHFEGIIQYFD